MNPDEQAARQRAANARVNELSEPGGIPAHPGKLDQHEKNRYAAAEQAARRAYPGVVGECLAEEIAGWREFGFRLCPAGRVERLVEHVLKAPAVAIAALPPAA